MKRCCRHDNTLIGKCVFTVLLSVLFISLLTLSSYVTHFDIKATVVSYEAIQKRCFFFSDKGYTQFLYSGLVIANVSSFDISHLCKEVVIETSVCEESKNDVILYLKQIYPINSTTHGMLTKCRLQEVNYSVLWVFTTIIFCILCFFYALIFFECRSKRKEYSIIN